ncbi:MAG TPA: alkaline phosphatase D family protein [Gaiellaceae bacterium]|nr:alkaline phosphatase D family protein [Gaiellaceae bacterium]
MTRLAIALATCAVLATTVGTAGDAAPSARTGPVVTHGIAVGDVTATSAVLWARADRESVLNVVLSGGPHRRVFSSPVVRAHDLTTSIELTALAPDTTYRVRAWLSLGARGVGHGPAVTGSFRTAPENEDTAPVRLAFGGDISGQNVCRDLDEGIPIADTIREWRPDVFVGLGDMIYADSACDPLGRYGNAQVPGGFGPAVDLAGFWAHWRYNRVDRGLQELLASASYVGVWDDHEVVNDFGPRTAAPTTSPYTGADLFPLGRQAFVDYTPLTSGGSRLYRSLRWGKHLELFVLDTRSFRDANSALDDPARPKTMLGPQQLAWLKQGLAASNATWKVVVSSVPMSIPTGFPPTNGRDGWANFDQATGFERELLDILRFMQSHGVERPVWITTDVHFAEAFRYRPFADDPSFVVHELATGPLNAGIFPTRAFDETLHPEVLGFVGPESAEAVGTWDEAKRWLNFGTLEIRGDGTLALGIVNTAGERLFSHTLPAP